MIEVAGLHMSFDGSARGGGSVEALRDINLRIEDNEFLTVLGPSGCGKTTLLRAIGGLLSWDAGEIHIDGKPIRGPGPERAMVFQNVALLPWDTVISNVAFGLELRGVGRAERERKAMELIDLVGLSGFERRMPRELSGGMQQRVGLARALAVEPKVLLMDEPFGALDEQTRRILQEELLRIWERTRTTVVFVTHSMDEAVLLGDRIALITARPGTVDEIVRVPLPRPRSRDVGSIERSAEFVAIRARLWERLREMQPDLRRPSPAARKAS
ncbi:MAG: ABC transporter ATP-binding protein [Candidatus Limnocylindria bacterium]